MSKKKTKADLQREICDLLEQLDTWRLAYARRVTMRCPNCGKRPCPE